MSSLKSSFAIAILSVLFAFGLPAQTVTSGISYTTDSTGTYLADLYRPSGAEFHPAIVLIHGGSWRSGNKHELRRLARDLAAHGYAGFSIHYDLHPHSFPTSWEEARAAVRFLQEHATSYGIDPTRIAVLGTSAGGQLAALLALAPEGPAGPQSSLGQINVAAAVLLNGGYDVHPKSRILRRYLGGSCNNIPDVCNDASPLLHMHPGLPPIFVGHGDHDHLIPYKQATDFIAALRAANDAVTPYVAEQGGHSYWKKRKYYGANLSAVELFLDNSLHR